MVVWNSSQKKQDSFHFNNKFMNCLCLIDQKQIYFSDYRKFSCPFGRLDIPVCHGLNLKGFGFR